MGEKYATEKNLLCKRFPANWKKYGPPAGPIRNSQMIDYISECENRMVVAFWDRKSSGTGDTVKKAKNRNIECIIVDV